MRVEPVARRPRPRGQPWIAGVLCVVVLIAAACTDESPAPEVGQPDDAVEEAAADPVGAVAPECEEALTLASERPAGTTPIPGTTAQPVEDEALPDEEPAPDEDLIETRPEPFDDDAMPVDGTRPEPYDDDAMPHDGTRPDPIDDDAMPQSRGPAGAPDVQIVLVGSEEPLAADDADPGDPFDLAEEVRRWAEDEAADSFAGLWFDDDGLSVAFARDARGYATEVRERFAPGIAVAAANHSQAELNDIQQAISEMSGSAISDAITGYGTDVRKNRIAIGIFDPDPGWLTELTQALGVTAICFDIEPPPEPPAAGVTTLAKATGWRDDLVSLESAYAILEVAYDRQTAERAWADTVPDDLEAADAEIPADPGRYGDLDDVDFDRQAVVVWSSGESGTCPAYLRDVDTEDDAIDVDGAAAGVGACDGDYNPYRVVAAVDRDRLPEAGGLADAVLVGRAGVVPGGVVRLYPDSDG